MKDTLYIVMRYQFGENPDDCLNVKQIISREMIARSKGNVVRLTTSHMFKDIEKALTHVGVEL
jgi:hypothetical protein